MTVTTPPNYPFDRPFQLDLHAAYSAALQGAPMRVQMPFGGPAWLVTRYRDACRVLSDSRFSRAQTIGRDVARTRPTIQCVPDIFTLDPPDHARLRRLVTQSFSPRVVLQLETHVANLIDQLITTMLDGGGPADLVAGLAAPLPTRVLCQLMGIPESDQDQVHQWTDTLLAVGDADVGDIENARTAVFGYLQRLLAGDTLANRPDSLLTKLSSAQRDGQLSHEELIGFSLTLIVAGHESTASHIGNFIYLLLTQRPLWNDLVAEPAAIGSAVEELLRYVPLAANADFARIATADMDLGGARIARGDAVIVAAAAANRDPAMFNQPDEVDLRRSPNPHIAFGYGAHRCIGAALARLELRLVLHALVTRCPQLHLAVPAEDLTWRTNRLVRGLTALPVAW